MNILSTDLIVCPPIIMASEGKIYNYSTFANVVFSEYHFNYVI